MNHVGYSVLTQVLPQAPMLLVFVGGLIFALVNWARWPRPCLLVTIAMGILLLLSLVQPLLYTLVVQQHSGSGRTSTELGALFAVVGVVTGVVRAGAYGLLLWAAFAQREKSPAR